MAEKKNWRDECLTLQALLDDVKRSLRKSDIDYADLGSAVGELDAACGKLAKEAIENGQLADARKKEVDELKRDLKRAQQNGFHTSREIELVATIVSDLIAAMPAELRVIAARRAAKQDADPYSNPADTPMRAEQRLAADAICAGRAWLDSLVRSAARQMTGDDDIPF